MGQKYVLVLVKIRYWGAYIQARIFIFCIKMHTLDAYEHLVTIGVTE